MTVFINDLKRIMIIPANWVLLLLFPLIFALLLQIFDGGSADDPMEPTLGFGIVDQDDSALSQALIRQLGLRYALYPIEENNIAAALTDASVSWVLLIREGYGADVLSENAPALEGYSLTLSDVSALGSVNAQNITRALMTLGTDDPGVLAAWEENAKVSAAVVDTGDNWYSISRLFGFFGFVSMFTAYFIIKTLMENKRLGMPDRLSVLPITPRKVLVQGTLAAFTATEVTVLLLMAVIGWNMGTIPNAPYLFILLSLYNLFCVGLMLAITSITRDISVAAMVTSMLATGFAMLGGLFWPLEITPEIMQRIAWFSPGFWLSRGFNNIHDISFEGFVMPVLFLSGFTLVVLLMGGWKRIQSAEM